MADSYILCKFDQGLAEETKYIGLIEHILRLNYDRVRPMLLKGKWWYNYVMPWRESTTFFQDECGFMRVVAHEFMVDHLLRHKPFVFPKDVNHIFLVIDRLHLHWLLVVDSEVRREHHDLPKPIVDELDSVV